MRAADRIAWIPIGASLNTNAPAAPVPVFLGTMADIAKAAPARITVGSAITGKDMKMPGSNSLKRQHQKAIRAYNLRREGLSVRETAELLIVSREKVRVLEVLGERLLSATSISN